MKRILNSSLVAIDGLLFYQDKLFSGIAFELLASGIVHPRLVKDGRLGDVYLSPYINDRGDALRLDQSDALSDYEVPMFNGEPFSGIAYSFSGDYCNREARISNGMTTLDSWWNQDGKLIAYERGVEGFAEVYEWYQEGPLEICKISTSDSYFGHLAFTANGKLKRAGSYNRFLKSLAEISAASKYFPLADPGSFLKLTCAKEVSLSGRDMDDSMIEEMCNAQMFSECERVELHESMVTKDGVMRIAGCASVKNIRISERNVEKKAELRPCVEWGGSTVIEVL